MNKRIAVLSVSICAVGIVIGITSTLLIKQIMERSRESDFLKAFALCESSDQCKALDALSVDRPMQLLRLSESNDPNQRYISYFYLCRFYPSYLPEKACIERLRVEKSADVRSVILQFIVLRQYKGAIHALRHIWLSSDNVDRDVVQTILAIDPHGGRIYMQEHLPTNSETTKKKLLHLISEPLNTAWAQGVSFAGLNQ